MTIQTSPYGFRAALDLPFDEALEKVTAALKNEGFGVLTEIDVKKTLKGKLDLDFRPYKILGACNPQLAHRALSSELEVGLLLPCNVVVYEDDEGKSVVSMVDPDAMLGVVKNEELVAVATEARERLAHALEAVAG